MPAATVYGYDWIVHGRNIDQIFHAISLYRIHLPVKGKLVCVIDCGLFHAHNKSKLTVVQN